MNLSLKDRVWNWIIETESVEWDFTASNQRDDIIDAVKAYIDTHGCNRISISSQNPYKVFLITWDEMYNFVPKPKYYAVKNGVLTKVD